MADSDLTDVEGDSELAPVVRRLRTERPVPDPNFRGALGRRLESGPRRDAGVGLRALKIRIGALAASGSALLALAAAGVLGAGPLG